MRKKRKENRVLVEPTGNPVPFPVFKFGSPLRFMVGPTEIDFNVDYWQERLRSNEIRTITQAEINARNKPPKLTEVEKKLDKEFKASVKKKKKDKNK